MAMSTIQQFQTVELTYAEIKQALIVAAFKKSGHYYGPPDSGYPGNVTLHGDAYMSLEQRLSDEPLLQAVTLYPRRCQVSWPVEVKAK